MKRNKNYTFIIKFFLVIKIFYSQNNTYSISQEINEKDEVDKYYKSLEIRIIYDSIDVTKVNPDSIKETEDIILCDNPFIYGFNSANTYLDTWLTSGNFFIMKNGQRILFDNNINNLKQIKLTNKINHSLLDSVIHKINPYAAYKIENYLSSNYHDSIINPLIIELSCNIHASVVKMKYKYLDINMYVVRREPIMLNCEEYDRYNKYIRKKYRMKKTKKDEDLIFGTYEKNYVFKKVKYIILIDIIELEIIKIQTVIL